MVLITVVFMATLLVVVGIVVLVVGEIEGLWAFISWSGFPA